jgi:cytochrome c peroxidase
MGLNRDLDSGSQARRYIGGALCLAVLFIAAVWSPTKLSPSFATELAAARPIDEPITPILTPKPTDPKQVALGERLFRDPRLSRGNDRSCNSCHDVDGNGATSRAHDLSPDGIPIPLNTPTVFNASGNFRQDWVGDARTLEEQAKGSIESPLIMGSTLPNVIAKLTSDPDLTADFRAAYGRPPDAEGVLNALGAFQRTLMTPDSRFDRWLGGDANALSDNERRGYSLFKSIGCVACHQGANVGGNLFQRHGIFHPLAAPQPALLRVPSLRNIASTAPYFHDGSASTLEDAIRRMAYSQLDATPADEEIGYIADFLRTLSGTYQGHLITKLP